FLAMTEGDNRNVIAAQLAGEALGARRVVAKINDPVRAVAYADLGLATVCRTSLQADAVLGYLGFPQSGMPRVHEPRASHHGESASADAPASPTGGAPETATAAPPRAQEG
ncbi:MAG TPA: hypothetical protein VH720_14475, partial [Candidatus Limnocylindrales bacterium]